MRKALVIIMVVALLGTITAYVPKKTRSINNLNNSSLGSNTSTSNLASSSNGDTQVTPTNTVQATSNNSSSTYKDGNYTGQSSSNRYGTVQISISISNGKINSVDLLSMPSNDRHSNMISNYAGPQLRAETINSQSANIDTISGATYTSESYINSLNSAIDQAKS